MPYLRRTQPRVYLLRNVPVTPEKDEGSSMSRLKNNARYLRGFLAYHIVAHWQCAPLWLLSWAGYYAYSPNRE